MRDSRVSGHLSRLLKAAGGLLLLAAAAHYAVGWYAQRASRTIAWTGTLDRLASEPAAPAAEGAAVARLRVPRIELDATVFEGVSEAVLRKGPGHLPSSAVPGRRTSYNNCVIAAHRDSFFRRLDRVRPGDSLFLDTAAGAEEYRLVRRRVVRPGEILLAGRSPEPMLTLVTCYPLRWIGPAPLRLVLQAELVPPSTRSATLSLPRG